MIDKYDLDLMKNFLMKIIDDIKNIKKLYIKYLQFKKEYLMLQYHIERNKKYAEYIKKHGTGDRGLGITKALELDLGSRYAWEILKPMSTEVKKNGV
jgi:hypothetical protein